VSGLVPVAGDLNNVTATSTTGSRSDAIIGDRNNGHKENVSFASYSFLSLVSMMIWLV